MLEKIVHTTNQMQYPLLFFLYTFPSLVILCIPSVSVILNTL